MSYNSKINVSEKISLPYPFSVNRALPIDARSFFTSFEEAAETVYNAVELDRDENGNFILPSEENGGVDSEYYFGQLIAVVTSNGTRVTFYTIVKKATRDNNFYGELEPINKDYLSNYLTESEVERLVETYVNSINVPCVMDYLFTTQVNQCDEDIPSDGLYAYGLKQEEGRIRLCDRAEKVLAFDDTPNAHYDERTNPLATVNTIKNLLTEKADEEEFKNHVENTSIHTEILSEKIPVNQIYLNGDKLSFVVGENIFSFKLTEWPEIPDYYVLFCNLSYNNGYNVLTNNSTIPYDSLTSGDLINMAYREDGTEDTMGYTVKETSEKELMELHDGNTVVCDYIIHSNNIPSGNNTILVLYRISGENIPRLDKIVWSGSLDNGILFEARAVNILKDYLRKYSIKINKTEYNVVGWYEQTVNDFDIDFGINFLK